MQQAWLGRGAVMSEMAAVCCIWECQWWREQAGSLWVGSGAALQLCDQRKKRVSVSVNGTLRTYTSCDILPWQKASAGNFVWHRFLMVLPLSLIGVPCSSHLLYKGGASSDLSGLPKTTAASFHPGGSSVSTQCCLCSMDHVQRLMSTSQVLNSCFAPWIFHQFRFWGFLINGSFVVFPL